MAIRQRQMHKRAVKQVISCFFKRQFIGSLIQSSYMIQLQQMSSHSNYDKIPTQKRKLLIYLVLQEHSSIAQSARQLNIKNSTAKLIIKRFRETKTYFQPKNPKKPKEKYRNSQTSSPELRGVEKQELIKRKQEKELQRKDENSSILLEREPEKLKFPTIQSCFQQQVCQNFQWNRFLIVLPNPSFYI